MNAINVLDTILRATRFKSQKERFELDTILRATLSKEGFKSQKERFEPTDNGDTWSTVLKFQIPEGTV